MKKRIMSCLLAVVLVLSMTIGTAFAAGTTDENSSGTTITGPNSTVNFVENGDQFEVTFTSGSLKPGEQYLVLMLSNSSADPGNPDASKNVVPTTSNILYIDQKAANADGSITFKIYPKSLTTGVVLITGVDASGNPTKLVGAIVKAKFIIGDADGNGDVDIYDAIIILQHLVNRPEAANINLDAANVDGTSGVDIYDAIFILEVLVGKQTLPK